jgi:hypothetical protein
VKRGKRRRVRYLEEGRVELLGELLALLLGHLPLVLEIGLVARYHERDLCLRKTQQTTAHARPHTHNNTRHTQRMSDRDPSERAVKGLRTWSTASRQRGWPYAVVFCDSQDLLVEVGEQSVAVLDRDRVHAQEALPRAIVVVPHRCCGVASRCE